MPLSFLLCQTILALLGLQHQLAHRVLVSACSTSRLLFLHQQPEAGLPPTPKRSGRISHSTRRTAATRSSATSTHFFGEAESPRYSPRASRFLDVDLGLFLGDLGFGTIDLRHTFVPGARVALCERVHRREHPRLAEPARRPVPRVSQQGRRRHRFCPFRFARCRPTQQGTKTQQPTSKLAKRWSGADRDACANLSSKLLARSMTDSPKSKIQNPKLKGIQNPESKMSQTTTMPGHRGVFSHERRLQSRSQVRTVSIKYCNYILPTRAGCNESWL